MRLQLVQVERAAQVVVQPESFAGPQQLARLQQAAQSGQSEQLAPELLLGQLIAMEQLTLRPEHHEHRAAEAP